MRFYFGKLKIILLILGLIFLFWPSKSSAALSTLSDVTTRQKESTASSHDILFTFGAGNKLDPTETVAIDFHEDDADFTVAGAATVVGDLDFTDGGVEADIVDVDGSCATHTGADDIVASINDTTGVLTFTACENYNLGINGSIINIEYGTAAAGPGTNRVTNPATDGSYIIDITAAGETGKLAVVIVDDDQVVVSTTIDPYLTFTVNQNTVTLMRAGGTLNPDWQNTGFNNGTANTLQAATNADSGYVISYNGATLTGAGGTIDAMAYGGSSTNTEQFGINLKDNTTPNTGANPSEGSGVPESDYDDADFFKFAAGTTTNLANSATNPSTTTTFTVTYIVNVSQTTEAGAYTTTITYICTGTF